LLNLTANDLEILLESLRESWVDSPDFSENPTAFEGIKRVNEDYMFCCPVHKESNPSCGISTKYPYVWHCFSCDASGTVYDLVNTVIKGSIAHAEYFIEKLLYFDNGYSKPLSVGLLSQIIEEIKKTKNYKVISEEEGLRYKGVIHPYLYKRGLSNKVINAYEVGYDKETNSIVFPIRDHLGNIRFLQRRSIHGKKFDNEKGVEKRDILYGLYYLLKSKKRFKELYVVESAIDAMSCYMVGLPSVALLGRVFYEAMLPALCLLKVNNIKLLLDNDKAGREATEQVSRLLTRYGFNVQVAVPIDGYKDANDLLLGGKLKDVEFTHIIFKQKGLCE
jgi:DNA primase